MRIDGLVTCTGAIYAAYLVRSLPVWAETLTTVNIATDKNTQKFFPSKYLHYLHVTDAFTRYGAHFNKGLALSELFGKVNPDSWTLNFDADILPEPDWRKKVEGLLEIGKLHGSSRRYREDNTLIPDSHFPDLWGFFHLWHVDDPHTWLRPVYPIDVGHAGNYDHTFQRRWEPENKVDLPIHLIHQGEPRGAWFGTENPKNEKYMNALHTLGLYEAWQTKAGHIQVPEFKHYVELRGEPKAISKELREFYTLPDPFEYHVVVK